MRRVALLVGLTMLAPAYAIAQSAGEVERCFQNPAACTSGGGGSGAPAPVAVVRPAPAPDYTTVLKSPESDRRKIQESLRTLDRYSGPIDGNLESEATAKAIGDWQRGRGAAPVGKLTPQEAAQLNAEAARVPIRRIEPPAQAAASPASPSGADALKALQARVAERRKAAEPKANAAAASLVADLNAYVAADGKGIAGEQFVAFAKWFADNKAAGRTIAGIVPTVDDYGDASAGAATATEVRFESRQGANSFTQCLMFAWVEGSPRKNPRMFSCDDVAAVEKWKVDQSFRSAWR